MLIVIIPHVSSTSTIPSLNINNLGAKSIYIHLDTGTNNATGTYGSNYYYANKPLLIMYDGAYFRVLNFNEASWNQLNGKPSTFNPTSHATTATTYGIGTAANYGHVKLINNITTAASGQGALDASKGKYLDDTCVKYYGDVQTVNIDEFRTMGFYSGSFDNSPLYLSGSSYGSLIVQWTDNLNVDDYTNKPEDGVIPAYVNQIFISEDHEYSNIYFRSTIYDNSWGPWKQLATTADLDKISGGSSIPSSGTLAEATGFSLIGQRNASTTTTFTTPTGEKLLGQLPSSKGSYYVTYTTTTSTTDYQYTFKRYNSITYALYNSYTYSIGIRCTSSSVMLDFDGDIWIAYTPYTTSTTQYSSLRRTYFSSSTSTSLTVSWTRNFTEAEWESYSGDSTNPATPNLYLVAGKSGNVMFFFNYASSSYSSYAYYITSSTSAITRTNISSLPLTSDYASSSIQVLYYNNYIYILHKRATSNYDYTYIYVSSTIANSSWTNVFNTDDFCLSTSAFMTDSGYFWIQYVSGSGTFANYYRYSLKLNGLNTITLNAFSTKYCDSRQTATKLTSNGDYIMFRLASNTAGYDNEFSGGASIGLYSLVNNEFVAIMPFCGMYESCKLDVANKRFYINQGNGKELVYEFTKLPTVT